jgi:hypothetical protein
MKLHIIQFSDNQYLSKSVLKDTAEVASNILKHCIFYRFPDSNTYDKSKLL